jgi:diaminohydroxyphosphoribosylaminopyrimidine deaminase / 5-amino-6-(5-phosphoribosylamino)uracil reductase
MNQDFQTEFMALAIGLAKQGLGKTKPNPSVGAVVIKNGMVLGKGVHMKAGQEHAEVLALNEAGPDAKGATLYVTLEPCAHHGKTPPCVDLIISSGIKRVVVASLDPNTQVNGKGLDVLRKNGIEVVEGVLQLQAEELNTGFFSRMTKNLPYIRSKIASSIDGRTSLANGDSKWITSEEARNDVQQWRARSCAILTGVGTINQDNPLFNVRNLAENDQPFRVIADTNLSIDLKSQILKQKNIMLAYSNDPNSKAKHLESKGVRLVNIASKDNKVDLLLLMKRLATFEFNEVLVESGPTLNGQLLELGLIDELVIYQAPIIMGGNANPLFHNPIFESMEHRITLKQKDIRQFGDDLRLIMQVNKS